MPPAIPGKGPACRSCWSAARAAEVRKPSSESVDSGPGVPEEELDKLFRPFYRIDDARGRKTGGVGLGLAITERAVRIHGGTVKASNRPEGGLQIEIRPASGITCGRPGSAAGAVEKQEPVETGSSRSG